jgi:hypothetical protein
MFLGRFITQSSHMRFFHTSNTNRSHNFPLIWTPSPHAINNLQQVIQKHDKPYVNNILELRKEFQPPKCATGEKRCDFVKNVVNLINFIHFEPSVTEKALTNKRLIASPSHEHLISDLCDVSERLHNNSTCGVALSSFVGSKGIGKSTVFRSFCGVVPVLFPSVIPIYINFTKRPTNHLMSIIADKLKPYNISFDAYNNNPENLHLFVQTLIDHNKYLLILADELDQLYRLNPFNPSDLEEAKAARLTLNQLAYLGDQPTGRVSVLLCSSSQTLPELIQCNVTDDLCKEFPLVVGAPRVDGTKFRVRRIPPSLPTNLHALESRLVNRDTWEKDKLWKQQHLYPSLRMLAFFCGTNARAVDSFLNSSDLSVDSFLDPSSSPDQINFFSPYINSHVYY